MRNATVTLDRTRLDSESMKVETREIDRVIPYAKNARKVPERAIEKVAASIKEFGWRVPIVVDKTGVIICGHTRLLAAKTRPFPRAGTRCRKSNAGAG